MAGRFVGFDDLVEGQRYRVTNRRDGTITGALESVVYFTQELKYEYNTSINGMVNLRADYGLLRTILATPDTTYELLPAAGGRHRKSRRSHKKSRKSRQSRRNVTG